MTDPSRNQLQRRLGGIAGHVPAEQPVIFSGIRSHRFTSIAEINQALIECVRRINERRHTRFGVTRRERFEQLERAALKPLPAADFDDAEWKDAKLHPECYVSVEATYYSAPHIHRGKKLRIRLTLNQVEIFLNGERLALHPRDRSRSGKRIKIDAHFPAASVAYYEATQQQQLSQSLFIHPDLNQLVVELFNADVYGNPLLRYASPLTDPCSIHPGVPAMSTAIARNLMAEMKLAGMLAAFDKIVADATRDQVSYSEFLDALLQAEADCRGERAAQRRLKAAKLPIRVCLDDFDYSAHRSIAKAQIREIQSLGWLKDGLTAAAHRPARRA